MVSRLCSIVLGLQQNTLGLLWHGRSVQLYRARRNKEALFQASAYAMFANTLLAKANYIIEPRVMEGRVL